MHRFVCRCRKKVAEQFSSFRTSLDSVEETLLVRLNESAQSAVREYRRERDDMRQVFDERICKVERMVFKAEAKLEGMEARDEEKARVDILVSKDASKSS